eukprot:1889265-Amphidinium_carterae.1
MASLQGANHSCPSFPFCKIIKVSQWSACLPHTCRLRRFGCKSIDFCMNSTGAKVEVGGKLLT